MAKGEARDILCIAPFPPPVHGQALATEALWHAFVKAGLPFASPIDTGSGKASSRLARVIRRARAHLRAAIAIVAGSGPCYLSANSNAGMWLTAVLAGLARLAGRRLVIHHHAYTHVARRRASMVALARLAGRCAVHLVLGAEMARDLRQSTPEVTITHVLNNAGLVDPLLVELPVKRSGPIVLGHMSNLTRSKGVACARETAVAAVAAGLDIRFVAAGPCAEEEAGQEISMAATQLGDRFEYRGAVHGADKRRFFADIDVFVFPSTYANEAEPLVLLEAMAAGVPCLSYARACITDDIGNTGGRAFDAHRDFVRGAMSYLEIFAQAREERACAARRRFLELLGEHRTQIGQLIEYLNTAA